MLRPDLRVRTTAPGPSAATGRTCWAFSSPGTESVCLDRAAGKGETHGMQWLKEMPNISWKSAWFLMYILNQSYTRWAECCSLIVCMRAPLTAQLVKNPPAMKRPQFNSWVGKIHWRRDRLPPPVFLGFPCGTTVEESTCNARDLGLIPGLERSPGEGKGYPTPIFWPGEFHGLYNPWGLKESDSTERLSL